MIKKYSRDQVNEILSTERNYRNTISIGHSVLSLNSATVREDFSESMRDKARQAISGLETYHEFFSDEEYDRSRIETILSKLESSFA